MELKNQNNESLNKQLNKTKLTMQVMTISIVIIVLGLILVGINGGDNIVIYSAILLPVSFGVIQLDKKYKKIKSELESRK